MSKLPNRDAALGPQLAEALPPHACIDNPFPFGWHAYWTTPGGLWDIRREGWTGRINIVGPSLEMVLHNPSADTVLAALRLHGGLDDPAETPLADWERDLLAEIKRAIPKPDRPTIVCLCGSTKFIDAFRKANLDETLAGRIVLSIGCDMRSDADLFANRTDTDLTAVKADLDELHLRKIDLADEVLVLNVGGYVGESTRREIDYACGLGKPIRWLESHPDDPADLAQRVRHLAANTGLCMTPDPLNPGRFCNRTLVHDNDDCNFVPAGQISYTAALTETTSGWLDTKSGRLGHSHNAA